MTCSSLYAGSTAEILSTSPSLSLRGRCRANATPPEAGWSGIVLDWSSACFEDGSGAPGSLKQINVWLGKREMFGKLDCITRAAAGGLVSAGDGQSMHDA